MPDVVVRPVGFFAEMRHPGREVRPLLKDAVAALAQPREEQIVAYLRAGKSALIGYARKCDVLQADWVLAPDAPGLLRTDGTWIWPSELAYYVERYHVRLPDEFAAWVRARDFAVPELPADVTYALADWTPTPPVG